MFVDEIRGHDVMKKILAKALEYLQKFLHWRVSWRNNPVPLTKAVDRHSGE